jgi:hypothetical protein
LFAGRYSGLIDPGPWLAPAVRKTANIRQDDGTPIIRDRVNPLVEVKCNDVVFVDGGSSTVATSFNDNSTGDVDDEAPPEEDDPLRHRERREARRVRLQNCGRWVNPCRASFFVNRTGPSA